MTTIKLFILTLMLTVIANGYCDEVASIKIDQCESKIDFPSNPSHKSEGANNARRIISSDFYQAILPLSSGGGIVIQVTCVTYPVKSSKYDLEKNLGSYFSAVKDSPNNVGVEIFPFVWLSDFNGYQRANMDRLDGPATSIIEGVFSAVGSNYTLSIRFIGAKDKYPEVELEFYKMINSLRLNFHKLDVSTVIRKIKR